MRNEPRVKLPSGVRDVVPNWASAFGVKRSEIDLRAFVLPACHTGVVQSVDNSNRFHSGNLELEPAGSALLALHYVACTAQPKPRVMSASHDPHAPPELPAWHSATSLP